MVRLFILIMLLTGCAVITVNGSGEIVDKQGALIIDKEVE